MPSNAEPSYNDLFTLGRAEGQSKRPDLSFRGGDISEMVVAASAAMGTHVATYATDRYRATTTEGEGVDLADLAEDHWQIQKAQATFAKGAVWIGRPPAGGAEPAGTLALGFVVATQRDASGKEIRFLLDAPLHFNLAELGPKLATITAETAGPGGDVGATAINRFPVAPFDATFTVSNTQPTAGGNPDESDDQLRGEIRAFPNAQRRATLDALAYWTPRLVPSVVNVTVVEEVVGGVPTGIVNLYVSDSAGNSNAQLLADVTTQLPVFKAGGAVVNVLGGVVVGQQIVVQIVLAAGLPPDTAAALVANVRAAIVAGVNKLPTGGTLLRGAIRTFGVNVDPDRIKDLVVVTPPTDVQPAANAMIRITESDVAVS